MIGTNGNGGGRNQNSGCRDGGHNDEGGVNLAMIDIADSSSCGGISSNKRNVAIGSIDGGRVNMMIGGSSGGHRHLHHWK